MGQVTIMDARILHRGMKTAIFRDALYVSIREGFREGEDEFGKARNEELAKRYRGIFFSTFDKSKYGTVAQTLAEATAIIPYKMPS